MNKERVKVIACLIVGHESKIIQRCGEALMASSFVDAYVVVNTVSNNQTTIDTILSTWKLPGRILHERFVNFGYNRTFAFGACRQYVEFHNEENKRSSAGLEGVLQLPPMLLSLIREYFEECWTLEFCYVLCVDADHIFQVNCSFSKESKESLLCAPGHILRQQNALRVRYYNPRLLQLSVDWVCIGRTHEQWIGAPFTYSDKAWIWDEEDGGSKGDKFERDIQFLLEDFKESPDVCRTHYYLGQSYFNSDEFEKSTVWFQKRTLSTTNPEEKWHARYMLGLAYLHLKKWKCAQEALLQAWNERPWRIEPLYVLMQAYRIRGEVALATMMWDAAKTIPFPSQDCMVVECDVYHAALMEECCWLGAHSKSLERLGWMQCEKLRFGDKTPDQYRSNSLSNEIDFIPKIHSERVAVLPRGEDSNVLDAVWGSPSLLVCVTKKSILLFDTTSNTIQSKLHSQDFRHFRQLTVTKQVVEAWFKDKKQQRWSQTLWPEITERRLCSTWPRSQKGKIHCWNTTFRVTTVPQFLPLQGGYLCMAYEKCHSFKLYRWLLLDASMTIPFFSLPFWLNDRGGAVSTFCLPWGGSKIIWNVIRPGYPTTFRSLSLDLVVAQLGKLNSKELHLPEASLFE